MSVRGEVIAILDDITMLGKRNYADERPEGETLPHTVLLDGVSQAPTLSGDSKTLAWSHLLQVDLWEDAGVATEATRDTVIQALDGAVIDGAFHLRVQAADRVFDPDRRLAHTAITLRTVRLRG